MQGEQGKASPPAASAARLPVGGVQSLLRSLSNAGVSVTCQDRDLRLIWARNIPPEWGNAKVGARDPDFLPDGQVDRLVAEKRSVIANGIAARVSLAFPGRDGMRWFNFWIDPDRSQDGSIRGIITTALESTDQMRREHTLKVLLREVSHRSKNLLAIIQSIATQTGRYSGTIDTFLARFRGRLQSLASSQDLVTSSNWRGADLHDLVLGQIARYTAGDPEKGIRFEGERPYLNPNAALHIGLAMHELAVNSVSYGALSRPGGQVVLLAAVSGENASRVLALCWRERIAPIGPAQIEKRFGSVALERVVPSSLGGTARLVIEDDRLEYNLVVPAGSFEVDP